jgi:hypothetical protein
MGAMGAMGAKRESQIHKGGAKGAQLSVSVHYIY